MYRLPAGTKNWFVVTSNGKPRKKVYTSGWQEKCPNGRTPYYGYLMQKISYDGGISSYAYVVPACKVWVSSRSL